MASAASLNAGLMDDGGSPKSRAESLVTDDRTTYDELIAPLESRMMRSIWRIVRNADLAEDSLQDALAVIWKKRHQVRQHPNPPALILKICLNAAYDSLRRLERMPRHTDLSQADHVPATLNQDAAQDLAGRELEEQVHRAIRRLPRKRALAVMMRLIHEEPFDAIARALDCSEVTVRIHVSKGRAQLRKWLSPMCRSSSQEAGK